MKKAKLQTVNARLLAQIEEQVRWISSSPCTFGRNRNTLLGGTAVGMRDA